MSETDGQPTTPPPTPGGRWVQRPDGEDPRDRDATAIAAELDRSTIDASDPAAAGDPAEVDPAGYPHATKRDRHEGSPTGS